MIVEEDLLGELLSRMASQHGFSSSQVAVALSGRSLFLREVMFPRMSEKELREAIHWDLEKYVPFSADQLYFDFSVIGPGSTEVDMRVLLAAVPREQVDSLVKVLRKAGLKPVAIEIAPLAVQRTLPLTQDCMLIDLGSEVSQVTLFQKDSPVFTRNIPIGGSQITRLIMDKKNLSWEEAELLKFNGGLSEEKLSEDEDGKILLTEVLNYMFELAGEIRRTIEYYRVQNRSVSILRVYLTGGGTKIDQVPEQLSRILELPVFVHDPLTGLEIAPSFNLESLKGVGPRMAIAIGLALRGLEKR